MSEDNFDDVYKTASAYLKAEDLKDKEVELTIDRTEVVDLDGQRKIVVYFKGKEKGLVLNVTNGRMIASVCGQRHSEWAGNKVILYPTKTEFQGNLVNCIRVRFPTERAIDDEIPF